jgi:hypothetical protein
MLASIDNNAESLSYRMSASSYQYQGLPMQCQYLHRMFGCWSNRAVLPGVRECRPYQRTGSRIMEEGWLCETIREAVHTHLAELHTLYLFWTNYFGDDHLVHKR